MDAGIESLPIREDGAASGVGIGRTREGHVFQAAPGLEVRGRDGRRVGTLKEVGPQALLVDRPWTRDVDVPFEAGGDMAETPIVLTIPAGAVDAMDWPHPGVL